MNTSMTKFDLKNPTHFLALGFGAGLIKPAPGTWGTLVAVPLYIGFMAINPSIQYGLPLLVLVTFVLGIYFCGKTARDVGVHDHGAIVWDEIVGYFISLLALPMSWVNIVLAFILFRVFDIIKPWPIKVVDQKIHGGFGIMFDDVLAGLMACVLLHLLQPLIVSL